MDLHCVIPPPSSRSNGVVPRWLVLSQLYVVAVSPGTVETLSSTAPAEQACGAETEKMGRLPA